MQLTKLLYLYLRSFPSYTGKVYVHLPTWAFTLTFPPRMKPMAACLFTRQDVIQECYN